MIKNKNKISSRIVNNEYEMNCLICCAVVPSGEICSLYPCMNLTLKAVGVVCLINSVVNVN